MEYNKNGLNLNNALYVTIVNDLNKLYFLSKKITFYIISEQICIFMTNNVQLSLERFKIIRLHIQLKY